MTTPLRVLAFAAAAGALGALAYFAMPNADEQTLAAFVAIGGVGLLLLFFDRNMDRDSVDKSIAAGEALEAAGNACLLADARGRVLWQGESWREIAGEADTLAAALDALARGDKDARDGLAALVEAANAGRPGSLEIFQSGEGGGFGRRLNVELGRATKGDQRLLLRLRGADRGDAEGLQGALGRLEHFVDSAPLGAVEVDAEGCFTYLNGVAANWIGLSAGEVVRRGLQLSDYLAEGSIDDGGLWSVRRRDERLLKVFATRIDQGGERRRFVLVDHSMELAWETALARAEERYRRLVELAPVGVLTLDRAGNVVEANVAFCELVGKSEAVLARTPFVDCFIRDSRAGVLDWVARGEKGERPKPLDAALAGQRERPVQLWSGSAGERVAEGDHVVLYVIDLSDRRNLETQFAHAQKMQAVGQMAGGIAHDFNNLLTAMIGHCDLLLLRHHAGDPSFADILQVKQNANRAASLVRQLLAFSRRQTLRPKIVDIAEVMSELANLLRRLIGQTVKLDLKSERNLGFVRVDTGQLEQVIVNLAVNARDAMPKGGRLGIRLSQYRIATEERLSHEALPAGDYLRIDLEDTGEGIPAENMDKIFEPFFTTKAVGAGTGLGLSTVYGIVKQTGGFIGVASAPGEGTTFSLYLPRIAPEAKEARAAAAGDAAGRGGGNEDLTGSASVLLVEDEFAVRSFAARALRNKGYKVIEAEDGQAALASIDKLSQPIDLMITDVLMPNVDGPTLIRRARKLRPTLKVIVISGYAEDAFRQELGADGDLGFLPKPFSLKDLAARVKETLGE